MTFSLDLSSNPFGPEGATHVAELLQLGTNSHLSTLALGAARIGDVGAAVLSEALSQACSAVTALDLSQNLLTGLTLYIFLFSCCISPYS